MFKEIVKRTYRVSITSDSKGNSSTLALQLDTALMSSGFKLSKELLEYLSGLDSISVQLVAKELIETIKELIGDNVKHNAYFKDFPNNIPDTLEFWMECLRDGLQNQNSKDTIIEDLLFGYVNLLNLPKYGKYLHSYEDMLKVHDKFIPLLSDRITILHLGKTLEEEVHTLYISLASSNIPLNDSDKLLLAKLAELCIDKEQSKIPIKENLSIINKVRISYDKTIVCETITDVLRTAVALSDGDITLTTSTKFKTFSRKVRRLLLASLDGVITSESKLYDVHQYKEVWKRLGERLHPYEYKYKNAILVFDVAYDKAKLTLPDTVINNAFKAGDILTATKVLSNRPGVLYRNIDRVLRNIGKNELTEVLETLKYSSSKVSGRVLLSVYEHIMNRFGMINDKRFFLNKKGTAWVTDETRDSLDKDTCDRLMSILREVITYRLPETNYLVVDNNIRDIALPLSSKNIDSGFNIIPRGTYKKLGEKDLLRFFCYWKQKSERTDYDLSTIFLDEEFNTTSQVSWTSLRGESSVHSGDITDAANGATEFINIDLGKKPNYKYIVPQVNIYAGETFTDVEECFFGYMNLSSTQKGKPFEPRTVRSKSDLRGTGKIALPLIFIREVDQDIYVKWLHLYLKGMPRFNRTETNRLTTSLMVQGIVNRDYLNVGFLVNLLNRKSTNYLELDNIKSINIDEPITYIGLEQPENLPKGSKVITLNNLHELIPV
jgi:hypothetical protein